VDVVDGALQKAGAERLLDVGRADDAAGATEEDFLVWKDDLFTFFVKKLGMEQHEVEYEPQLSVVQDDSLDLSDLHTGEPLRSTDKGSSEIRPLKIRGSRELFGNTSRNCLHLDLDLTEHPQITYKTGDHLAVWAMNPDEEVERLLGVLGLTGDRRAPLLVQALDKSVKVPLPSPTTVEAVLRHYLEICAPISRDAVKALAQFAPTEEAKSFLAALSEDRASFARFIADKHLNFGRLLEMAAQQGQQQPGSNTTTWKTLPLSFLIETLPKMHPRYYSISSSSMISPRHPTITALVSTTPLAITASTSSETPSEPASIPGLATNYLLGLSHSLTPEADPAPAHPAGLTYPLDGPSGALSGGKVYAHMRRSRFKLPAQPSHPLVMVAAGTGVAPFRAFLAERARMLQIGKEVGEMVLFFGCRRPGEDYIYREELEGFERELKGRLRIVTAFSRVDGQPKEYVQDRVRELGDDVVRLVLEGGASVYICGRASMAREVGGVVGELVGKEKGWGQEQTKEWTERMKRNRTWQEDVWG
jgi:NADPH-ferrihemoprotein reductase